jgi:hypothetical protein
MTPPDITPDERDLLPEDLSAYTVELSIWRLSWDDIRQLRKTDGDDATDTAAQDSNIGLLQKALKVCTVRLTSGDERTLPDAAFFPFPLLAEANRLLKAAMDKAANPGN